MRSGFGGLVTSEGDARHDVAIVIERFADSRSKLLNLFTLADDSLIEIAGYLESGEIFVARRGSELIGHVQTIAAGHDWEIKSLAVVASEQSRGVGSSLIRTALANAWRSGAERV